MNKLPPILPAVGDVWQHERARRDIAIDRLDGAFVYATGVQSRRPTRIRLTSEGCLPRPWFRLREGGLMPPIPAPCCGCNCTACHSGNCCKKD